MLTLGSDPEACRSFGEGILRAKQIPQHNKVIRMKYRKSRQGLDSWA